MNRPVVSPLELWAAQAQFGPFDEDVIREVLAEWDQCVRKLSTVNS